MPNTQASNQLNKSAAPRVAILLIAIGVVVALGWYLFSGSSPKESSISPDQVRAFYTDDDGKTTFTDQAGKMAPFDHNGKQAVEAVCFSADGGKTHFVGYLRCYTEQGRKTVETMKTRTNIDPVDASQVLLKAQQVKRPGDKTWTQFGAPGYDQITNPKSPDGRSGPDIFPYTPTFGS